MKRFEEKIYGTRRLRRVCIKMTSLDVYVTEEERKRKIWILPVRLAAIFLHNLEDLRFAHWETIFWTIFQSLRKNCGPRIEAINKFAAHFVNDFSALCFMPDLIHASGTATANIHIISLSRSVIWQKQFSIHFIRKTNWIGSGKWHNLWWIFNTSGDYVVALQCAIIHCSHSELFMTRSLITP